MRIRQFFYFAKPLIPRSAQIVLRRTLMQRKRRQHADTWPIHPAAAKPPENWQGWPQNKRFAVVLTHDVELQKGHDQCERLMSIEKRHGFAASYNFVPERYQVSPALRAKLEAEGFEVGVHGLNHDGKLYRSREEFARRAEKINQYLKSWGVTGFRSPAMHHNLDWLRDLDITYDASTFDTDPFEPQPDGACTIFPFTVADDGDRTGYVELPYTLPQDFSLFVIFQERTVDIWKKKVDWIAAHGGMVLINVHPDYMHFGPGTPAIDEYPASFYEDFLKYLNESYAGQFWHALPKEVAAFWRDQVTPSPSNHQVTV